MNLDSPEPDRRRSALEDGSLLGRRLAARGAAGRRGRLPIGAAGAVLCICALLLSGCGAIPKLRQDRTRFYTLGEGTPAATATAATPAGAAPRILVRRVELPGYLQPKALAVRRDGTEVDYIDAAWWSESLDAAVLRVLRERLAQSGIPTVARRDQAFDYELVVRVDQLEGRVDDNKGSVVFRASYELQPAGGGRASARQNHAPPPVEWNGRDYEDLVRKLSAAVAGLAGAVGDAVRDVR